MEKLPAASQASLRAQLITQYNELNKLSANKLLHDVEVERVQIEDDLFVALLAEKGRPHAQGDPFSPAYLDAVRRLVENRMKECKVRLDNLKEAVAKDEALKDNPARLKAVVLERARAIEKGGVAAAQGTGHRRALGQPATEESDNESRPTTPVSSARNKTGSSPPRRPRHSAALIHLPSDDWDGPSINRRRPSRPRPLRSPGGRGRACGGTRRSRPTAAPGPRRR